MKHTFKGGIHPREGKHLSKDKPIREYLPKGDTVYWNNGSCKVP